MPLEVRDSRLYQVIAKNAQIEQVVTGFEFTEGPVWHPYEKHLTFSDILGDTIYRWHTHDGLNTFRSPSHNANGNTYDQLGRILTCEHSTRRVTRTAPDGSYEILASHYSGQELNSPNDIVVKQDGAIYFTDPAFGRTAPWGIKRDQILPFQGVYRLDPADNSLILLADDFDGPNGLCFSPDQAQLFVNDSYHGQIRAFTLQENGTIKDGRVWAETTGEEDGVADGMKMDQAGHLFCAGPGGIHLFDPTANCLGVIRAPEPTANFCWGDDDLRTLYLTSCTSVYRLRMEVPGPQLFHINPI